MQDWEAKKAARASVAAALQAANPQLIAVGQDYGKNDSLNAAAKNMRLELKAAFPGVKFSVKSSRFSGGDSISVSWIDGPIKAQVDPIIDKYEAGSFNSMEDIYEYGHSAWKDAFGDAKYVGSSRQNSDAAVAAAIRTVKAVWGQNLDKIGLPEPSVESFRKGTYHMVEVMDGGWNDHWSLQSIIYRAIAKRTWALTKAAVKKLEPEEV